MKIENATADDVYKVAMNMRESDVREFLALSNYQTHQGLVIDLLTRYGDRDDLIVAKDEDGEPIAVGGLFEHRPNVVTLLFFATDRFKEAAFGLSRFIKGRLFPKVKAAGAHRIEAASIEGHDEAHRWIKFLGLEPEAEMRGFGKNRETFIQFAWVDDVRPAGS